MEPARACSPAWDMVSPADPSAMASTARGRRQCEGLSVARLRGLRGPASYNTILFNRGRPAADSCTTPSRELREVWRRGAWSIGLGTTPIVCAVKFYTYGQAAGKRFAVSLARKIAPCRIMRTLLLGGVQAVVGVSGARQDARAWKTEVRPTLGASGWDL